MCSAYHDAHSGSGRPVTCSCTPCAVAALRSAERMSCSRYESPSARTIRAAYHWGHSGAGPWASSYARCATSVDSKNNALLGFVRLLVDQRGRVSDGDLATLRSVGFDDGAIAEIVANVALNIFTNYFNHVAETDIDFPKAEPIVDHHEVCASIPGCDETR